MDEVNTVSFLFLSKFDLPWVTEVFSRLRRGASFRRPQAEDTSGSRLDRNRKPRIKSLWHQGQIWIRFLNYSAAENLFFICQIDTKQIIPDILCHVFT